ncbi:MAG: cache domain-containing protein, partial [Anaerolineales bacterium]|nr:cache domain-containing protein [Anaerolineales bacterium]
MAKTHKPNEEEKIVKENIQKRFKNMFSGENEPLSNMSLKEAEALKARIAELEALVAGQPAVPAEPKTAAPTAERAVRPLPLVPVEQAPADQQGPAVTAELEKRIGLWVTGILVAVGLAFFGVALYIVFILQSGMWELSDKVLLPYSVLMFVGSAIGWSLVRRGRQAPGIWLPYLVCVILGPTLVVLVLQSFYIMMVGYLALFSILFIALILPRKSRLPAILVAVGAALVMTGIELWNPAFRLSTSHIQNFTLMILGPAALAILAIFTVTRQLRNSRIETIKKNGAQTARSLTATLAIAFFTLSIVILLINGGTALFNNYLSYQETLSARQLLVAQDASKTVANSIQEKFSVLETIVESEDLFTADSETKQATLESLLGLQPAFRQLAILSPTGRQLAQISRQSSALAQQFKSRLEGDVLTQTKDGQRYISPVYIDDVTSEPQVVIAVPIQNVFGDFQGVLVAELNLKFMWDLVDQLEVGETGYA